MSKQVKEKVYLILSTDSQLQTLLGGSSGDTRIYPEFPDNFEDFSNGASCIVYRVEDGGFRTAPRNAKDIVFEHRIYSKVSMDRVEDIAERILELLNYISDNNNIIVYAKQIVETDMNEKDRQLFSKLVRYSIWSIKS